MKKVIVAFGIIFISNLMINIFQSCKPCNPGSIDYRIKGLYGEALVINGTYINGSDTLYNTYNYVPGETINYDSLIIRILNTNTNALNKSIRINSFGINSAYACSPGELFDEIKNIIITSSEDYNGSYPKGSDLRNIILARLNIKVSGISIDNFLKQYQHSGSQLGDISFTFSAPPDQTRNHDITVKYILADGREFQATVVDIRIRE